MSTGTDDTSYEIAIRPNIYGGMYVTIYGDGVLVRETYGYTPLSIRLWVARRRIRKIKRWKAQGIPIRWRR